MAPSSDPRGAYEARFARFAALEAADARRSRRLSHARFACFGILLAAGLWAEWRPGGGPLIALAVLAAAFVGLLVVHGRVRSRERWHRELAALNREGLARLDRRWADLAERPLRGRAGRETAEDLDLFGSPSLAQLMGPTVTPGGEEALAGSLLDGHAAEAVEDRQAAVRELAARIEFRDAFAAAGRIAGVPPAAALEGFMEWAESTRAPRVPRWLSWTARLLPAVLALAVALAATGMVASSIVLLPLLASAWLGFGRRGRSIRAEQVRALGSETMFRAYPELFRLVGAQAFDARMLTAWRERLATGDGSAARLMGRLARLAHLAGLRGSPMMHVPVQLATLWDVHVVERLDAWRIEAGPHVRGWFAAAGRIDALSALSALAHDHPEWVWPEIDPALDSFVATGLGHPMLEPARRVDNDVDLGGPGRFLLVTGSNMSGKSTLLRAIGQNASLALAGAPVCARQLRMPPLEVRTAIHVLDSLTDGVSFFMAQLHRLKAIVEAAEHAAAGGGHVLFLLDEILQGTNTAERRIAAARVIRHLVDQGAIGAVTTHDLELATAAEVADAAVPVHFRETVHPGREPALTFDYVLRSGVATSTNALRLMEIVGLAR